MIAKLAIFGYKGSSLIIKHSFIADGRTFGADIPEQYERIIAAWFPGGGTPLLPQPYSHSLD
jgi:hypothetical protein